MEEQGFEVVILAKHGRDLIDQLDNAALKPMVCIIDSSMPIMGGLQTTSVIRELYPKMKIVGYTADFDAFVKNEFIKAGANDAVAKLFDIEKIAAIICGINLP